MDNNLDPVKPIAIDEIREARARIRATIARTPMFPLDLGPGAPDVRLKLENLQPTNSYKMRGAANAIAMLSAAARQRGVWTISAGNAGQAIAYAARQAGIRCTIVAIETAPRSKLERMQALGASLIKVPYSVAWKAFEEHAFPGIDATLVHPFDDHNFIAGHGTMGLEILEDVPDVRAIIAAVGGGGLITGIASATKVLRPEAEIFGAEPETAAPLARSLSERSPQRFPEWKASFVDGSGGKSVTPRMWDRMQGLVDGSIVVTLEQTKQAVRMIADKARTVSEGAGALSLAAALSGQAGRGPIVAIVSGGNIDLDKLADILTTPAS